MKRAVELLLKNPNLKSFLEIKTPILHKIFSSCSAETDGLQLEMSRLERLNANDIQTYFESTRTHKEMMDRYWPVNGLSTEEKLKRTANMVGFDLPKQGSPLSDLEKSNEEQKETEKILASASA